VAGESPVYQCDLAVVGIEEDAIARGDAKGIGGQVLQGRLAVAYRDEVHAPVSVPDMLADLVKEAGLLEQVAQLRPKDLGEWFFGQEVVGLTCSPRVAMRSEAATGDEVVDVRVVAQV